jgi:hypothetical protein
VRGRQQRQTAAGRQLLTVGCGVWGLVWCVVCGVWCVADVGDGRVWPIPEGIM